MVEEKLYINLTMILWEKAAVDVIHLHKGVGNFKYIVVARQDMSVLPESHTIQKANFERVVKLQEEYMFSRHGCPLQFVVDSRPEN